MDWVNQEGLVAMALFCGNTSTGPLRVLAWMLVAALSGVSGAAEVLVVCPAALRGGLDEWVRFRESQGHRFAFAAPLDSPAQTMQSVRERAGAWRADVVLLVGDAAAEGQAAGPTATPTGFVRAEINRRWGSEPTIATDIGYADTDGDGRPDAAVGRVPCGSADELKAYLKRVIAFESQRAPTAHDHALTLVASPGHFSPLLDGLIESLAIRIFDQLTPASCDLHVTYADWRSPYCPYPPRMPQAVSTTLQRRSLAWVYLGHGLRDRLDVLRTPHGHARILDCELAESLNGGKSPALAAIVACYAGAYDGDCLAESLLAAPGGPLVVLAGSRVTMPYGNTVFGLELLRGLFHGDAATIGELVAAAKQRLTSVNPKPGLRGAVESLAAVITPKPEDRAAERLEHAQMYNLLGDPLLAVRRPQEIPVTARAATQRSQQVTVTGDSPIEGDMLLRLVRPRIPKSLRVVRDALQLNDEFEAVYNRDYASANRRTIREESHEIDRGRFSASVAVPEEYHGRDLEVVVLVQGQAGLATGHAVVVRPEPAAVEASEAAGDR